MFKRKDSFWVVYFAAQFISLFLFDFDFYYQAAIAIFNYQFLSFYFEIGKGLNIRYLIGTIYSLNYLFAPVLMYTWLNPYVEIQYTLKGDPNRYFEYVLPGIAAMLLGLHLFAAKEDNILNVERLKEIVKKRPALPLQLIVVGSAVTLVSRFIPDQADLVLSAVGNLRYVGLFLHILTAKRLNIIYFAVTYGVLAAYSVVTSMFNDLLNLLFFLASVLAIRVKPNAIQKLGGIFAGILFIMFIQIIKMPLRMMVTQQEDIELENLDEIISGGLEQNSGKETDRKVADVMFRVSQGWVTSNVLEFQRENGFQLQQGQHMTIMLKSSVLPRVLAPDKYIVGDRDLFNSYTGHFIREGTSIALGIVSDAYIDFAWYGIVVLFLWGLLFSYSVKFYTKWDTRFPLFKLTSVLCYFYAVRADTDTHSALGSLIKISAVLWLISYWFDKYFFKFISLGRQLLTPKRGSRAF